MTPSGWLNTISAFAGRVTRNGVERLQAIQKALIMAGVQCYPNTQETALIIGNPNA
jgi:hypothetical protein